MAVTKPTAASLERLAALRQQLQQFCRLREDSIWAFYDGDVGWFRLTLDGAHGTAGASVPTKIVNHLTTTLTALEALGEAPLTDKDIAALQSQRRQKTRPVPTLAAIKEVIDGESAAILRRHAVLRHYVSQALANPGDWRSDGAAYVYCRVRTLGAAGRLLSPNDPALTSQLENLRALLDQAWWSHPQEPSYGLRESTEDPNTLPDLKALSDDRNRDAYVPNSFLTYWGLLALRGLGPTARLTKSRERATAARHWLGKSLAEQVAFHYAEARNADPQQLAWALCGHVNFGEDDDLVAKTTPAYAQLEAGVKAFFAQQLPEGDWPKGQPLFFYQKAGNAYCYVYETLAELLSLATRTERRFRALRELLREHVEALEKLFRLAVQTQQQLGADTKVGWSSGHNPRRVAPEAWATASVYRFAEALRRLVGVWTTEEAQRLLGARTPSKSLRDLKERGGTWNVGRGSAGAQLATGFLNPILRQEGLRAQNTSHIPHPDTAVVPEGGARSAILFGPPGTGKTTLVEAVAGALDWPFIEITPAQFLDRGVEMVSARADEIFRQVMELDRCVVLLDEIDELIQDRSKETAEPVERFFTTTMLPRLAKLWSAQRILFFVNTNDIFRVDVAIRRSQRFDATILVLPPGYAQKSAMLQEDGLSSIAVTEEDITAQLQGQPPPGRNRAEDARLAWFALLRHDQMKRFGPQLRGVSDKSRASRANVSQALPPYIAELRALDWHEEGDPNSDDAPPRSIGALLAAQRRDLNVRPLARRRLPASASRIEYVEIPPTVDDLEAWAENGGFRLLPDGFITDKKP